MPNVPLPFMRQFGELVRHYRQMHGMSIEQLAAASGLAASAISTLESGARTPPPPKQFVTKLAETFELQGEDRRLFELAGTWDSQFLGTLGNIPQQLRARLGGASSDPVAQQLRARLGGAASEQVAAPLAASILVFLIADVRGFTRFTQDEGDAEAARLAAKFAGIARAAVEQWDGRLLELRGDEALAVFASARMALRAALDLQVRFAEATAADGALPLLVGIGLDVGEPTPLDTGYRGAALNRAARLCSLAGAGQILLSAALAHIVSRPDEANYVEHGRVALKGFDVPTEVLRLVRHEPVRLEAEQRLPLME